MRTILLALALSCALPACGPAVVLTTPEGKTAYVADNISVRVTELEKTAIDANAAGKLKDADTRTILDFATTAQKTLAVTPDGWRVSLKTAWHDAKGKLPATTNPAIAAAFGVVDALIEGL